MIMLPEGAITTEDKMTIDERRKYLCRMKRRYLKGSRREKGRLLDEMEAVTEMHRKSLIRLMNGSLERKPRSRQRGRTYGPEVEYALSVIAESLDYPCPERLTPNLVWMANHLAAHGELKVSPPLLEKLDRISVPTVGRILGRIPLWPQRLRGVHVYGSNDRRRHRLERTSSGVRTQLHGHGRCLSPHPGPLLEGDRQGC